MWSPSFWGEREECNNSDCDEEDPCEDCLEKDEENSLNRICRRLPHGYHLEVVRGNHRRGCSECGSNDFFPGDNFVTDGNIYFAHKICMDCVKTWLETQVEEHSESEDDDDSELDDDEDSEDDDEDSEDDDEVRNNCEVDSTDSKPKASSCTNTHSANRNKNQIESMRKQLDKYLGEPEKKTSLEKVNHLVGFGSDRDSGSNIAWVDMKTMQTKIKTKVNANPAPKHQGADVNKNAKEAQVKGKRAFGNAWPGSSFPNRVGNDLTQRLAQAKRTRFGRSFSQFS